MGSFVGVERTMSTARFAAIAFRFGLFFILALLGLTTNVVADAPVAPSDDPYVIAILISSQDGSVSQTTKAITHLSMERIGAINRAGGINDRAVRAVILDDKGDGDITVENVTRLLKTETNLIAMIGLWSSTRGVKVIDLIGERKIPFVSEISLDKKFARYPSIFTLTRSVSDDLRIFRRFLKDNYKSVAFFGLQGDLFTGKFHESLEHMTDGPTLSFTNWTPSGQPLDEAIADEFIAQIRAQNPDVICLAVGSDRGGAFIERLAKEGITKPIYAATGSISRMHRNSNGASYAGAMFQTKDSIPGVDNERLARLKRRPNFLSSDSNFTDDDLTYGVIYGDIVDMVGAASQGIDSKSTDELRVHIVEGLRGFAAGKKFFKGNWRDWSFTPERASAETTFVLWRPEGGDDLKLWPTQYLITPGELQKGSVIYASIDMDRIFRIDSNEKSFDAEFYFSLRSDQGIGLDAIEFTNVARGEVGDKPLIATREISLGQLGALRQPGHKLYKVQGRFLFEPQLTNYPFDEQRFPISFQPFNAASPIFLQPPPAHLRDTDFDIDGWTILETNRGGDVGTEQEVVSIVQDYVSDQRIMSFYKFNFSWLGKRNALDYYLRVVVPLALIMIIAYFSIFVPNSNFESVIAIQVTALLSAIALYLAIPKLDSDSATLSDQIFVFTEMTICLMIVLSILRVNVDASASPVLGRVLAAVQILTFPILAFLMLRYVMAVSSGTFVAEAGQAPNGIVSVFRALF